MRFSARYRVPARYRGIPSLPTTDRLRGAFQRGRDAAREAVPQLPVPGRRQQRSRAKRRAVVTAVVVGTAVGATAAYLWWRHRDEEHARLASQTPEPREPVAEPEPAGDASRSPADATDDVAPAVADIEIGADPAVAVRPDGEERVSAELPAPQSAPSADVPVADERAADERTADVRTVGYQLSPLDSAPPAVGEQPPAEPTWTPFEGELPTEAGRVVDPAPDGVSDPLEAFTPDSTADAAPAGGFVDQAQDVAEANATFEVVEEPVAEEPAALEAVTEGSVAQEPVGATLGEGTQDARVPDSEPALAAKAVEAEPPGVRPALEDEGHREEHSSQEAPVAAVPSTETGDASRPSWAREIQPPARASEDVGSSPVLHSDVERPERQPGQARQAATERQDFPATRRFSLPGGRTSLPGQRPQPPFSR